jgi:hypothetical protein
MTIPCHPDATIELYTYHLLKLPGILIPYRISVEFSLYMRRADCRYRMGPWLELSGLALC